VSAPWQPWLVDDLAFGRLIKLARLRRGWRQVDLATRTSVSRTTVSRVERGHIGSVPLDAIRAVAAALEIRVEVTARARAIDLDRIVNARHSAMAEFVTSWLSSLPEWVLRPEVSFSEYGERGVIDLLCWHAISRSLLVIEIKTELVDLGDVLGRLDIKRRHAPKVARELGWEPARVSICLLVANSMTNRRRAAGHVALLSAALPDSGRAFLRWLKNPAGEVHALRFVSDARQGHVRNAFASPTRVRTRGPNVGSGSWRSARGDKDPNRAPSDH
jgi:transcriptional regulator with XRE-family HTH domain